MLAGPKMSESPTADVADIMLFCAKEFQAFFGLMKHALNQYKADGQLPDTILKQGATSHTAAHNPGDTKNKGKRRPTAFNMFVKEKMEEFKAAGVKLEDDRNGNQLFALAVDHWKKLDEMQKQQYIKKHQVSCLHVMA